MAPDEDLVIPEASAENADEQAIKVLAKARAAGLPIPHITESDISP
jgi:hypothetical protein